MHDDDAKLRLNLAHRSALAEYATPIVGDRMRAEDVAQKVYLRLVPATAAGSRIDQPAAYLYRIVRNLAYDLRRSLSADHRRDEAHLVLRESLPDAPSPVGFKLRLFGERNGRLMEGCAALPRAGSTGLPPR